MQKRGISEEATVAASLVGGLVAFAAARGANRDLVLTRSGLAARDFEDGDARIPLSRYRAAFRAAEDLLCDPALALHYAEATDMSEISVLGLITRSSATMLDAFHQINRYGRLVIDSGQSGSRYRLEQRGSALWLVDTFPVPDDFPELAESPFAFMVCNVRSFTDRRLVHEVRLMRRRPSDPAEYERIFGVPVEFDAHENAMLMDEVWPDFPVSVVPRYAFGILGKHADELLERLEAERSASARVRSILMPLLHTGACGIATVAKEMGMSRQTLYRRLAAEGTSFERVLDDLRRRLSLEYLEGGRVSISEIAYLVGFSDRSTFTRAFKRWTGRAPGRIRARFR